MFNEPAHTAGQVKESPQLVQRRQDVLFPAQSDGGMAGMDDHLDAAQQASVPGDPRSSYTRVVDDNWTCRMVR